jgi:O-antigen ligase
MLQAIAYPIFLASCLMGVLRPAWALALVLAMYGAEQLVQASGGVFLSFPPLANYMVAVVAGIAAIRSLLSSPNPFSGYVSREQVLTLIVFGWSALSLLWTPASENATDMILKGLPYFILFVLLAPLLTTDAVSLRRAWWALLIIGVPVAIGLMANPEVRSAGGRLGVALSATVRTNPLAVGDLGGMLVIVGVLLRSSDRSGLSFVLRVLAVVLGLALALMSGSRGQLIFALLVSVALVPIARRVRSIGSFFASTAIIGVVVGLVFLIAPLVLDRFGAQRWDADRIEEGAVARLNNVLVLVEAQAENPLSLAVGLGFNAFTAYSPEAEQPYSHNVPLDILSELGLPAFVAFAALLYAGFRDSQWLHRRFSSDPDARSTLAVLFGLALFCLMVSLKQGHLWSNCMLFMTLSMIGRMRMRSERDDAEFDEVDGDGRTESGWNDGSIDEFGSDDQEVGTAFDPEGAEAPHHDGRGGTVVA